MKPTAHSPQPTAFQPRELVRTFTPGPGTVDAGRHGDRLRACFRCFERRDNACPSSPDLAVHCRSAGSACLLGRWDCARNIPAAAPRPAPRIRTGIVVTTRDRPPWLAECLESILRQTSPAAAVVVVDDSQRHQATRKVVERFAGVRYLRRERIGSNPAADGRRQGIELLAEDQGLTHFLAIDDDDTLSPDCLEQLQAIAAGDETLGVVYPVLRFFGDQVGEIAEEWDPATLRRRNYIGCCGLVRRDAYNQAGGWNDQAAASSWEDWELWKRIASLGWQGRLVREAVYHYRRHAAPARSKEHRGYTPTEIASRAGQVTIAIPVSSGRELPDLFAAIERQTFGLESCQVLILDDSGGKATDVISEWLARIPAAGRILLQAEGRPIDARGGTAARAVNDRVAGHWARIARSCSTPWLWCLEHDVIPPADALEQLWLASEGRQSISGAYPARFGRRAWAVSDIDPEGGIRDRLRRGRGIEEVASTGFGCLLVVTERLREAPLVSHPTDGGTPWYDPRFFQRLAAAGHKHAVHWDVVCEHRTGR